MFSILVWKGEISTPLTIVSSIFLVAIFIFNKVSSVFDFMNQKWLIVFAILNLLIVVPELSLRLIDFSFEPGVSYGNLSPVFKKIFVPDKDLMWKHSSDEPGINSYGFYGPEVTTPKSPNIKRILFFGDSCAEQNYARILEQYLNENKNNPDIIYECLIFAVAGYSSYQGRILVEKYSKILEADLAFVCYGWNDHWLTLNGKEDEQYDNKISYAASILNHYSKILQLTRKVIKPLFEQNKNKLSDVVRIPAKKYRDNINYIVDEQSRYGTDVILLTAPTSFYYNDVPDFIISSGLATSKKSAIAKHREYNEIIREIAKNKNIDLLDAEKLINEFKNRDSLFLKDGIHFSPDGLNYMASLIYSYMIKNQFI